MSLINFRASNGKLVCINPEDVSAVEPSTYNRSGSVIHLKAGAAFAVDEDIRDVSRQINEACGGKEREEK